MYYTQFIFEVDKPAPCQCLGQNISCLLYRHALESDFTHLNTISNMMVLDLNVLGAVMKHWIVREIDVTLIIIVYDCGLQFLTEQPNKWLHQPYGLPSRQAGSHVLGLN